MKESSYLRLRTRTAATSGTIRQALADHAVDRLIGTILIVNAKRNPVRIAEITLAQIAVQVLLGAMLIDAPVPRLKIE